MCYGNSILSILNCSVTVRGMAKQQVLLGSTTWQICKSPAMLCRAMAWLVSSPPWAVSRPVAIRVAVSVAWSKSGLEAMVYSSRW